MPVIVPESGEASTTEAVHSAVADQAEAISLMDTRDNFCKYAFIEISCHRSGEASRKYVRRRHPGQAGEVLCC